ncbi:nucleotidyltransferase family protein [Leptolyngbya sp. PCC 6406]|uniref:nucleotidyltransferase family protein n=1 Tax=Leptolyngbya sp. PCC 6406 TaxID=1173264 RepID=UPI0002AC043C|nr:nucleotidyltransferase family protein [Leptolyngbya sp. PCC 6406]
MAVTTKEQVIHLIEEHHQDLQRLGVHRCGLFGSFVRNAMTEQSDVDILVEFEPQQKTFNNFMDLCFFLEKILGRNVDLVTRESLSPYIGPRILKEVEYISILPEKRFSCRLGETE